MVIKLKINKVHISGLLSIIATIYTIFYMNLGTVYDNSGALSKIGIEHKFLFVIWGILTTSALTFAICLAYKKYCKTKIHLVLITASIIGMILTLCFDFDYEIKTSYYLHCIGSLTFSVAMGLNIFIFYFLNRKKELLFRIFTVLTATILIADLVCLIIFKETALIETIPVFAGYILLGTTNLRRDKVEINR